MNEIIKQVLEVLVPVIGLPTAVFGMVKAVVELKKAIRKKQEVNKTNNIIDETNVSVGSAYNSNIASSITNIKEVGSIVYTEQKSGSSKQNILNENLILKDKYVSVLAEKGKILNETIKITNLGNGKIEGEVFLKQDNTYILNGTFKNGILTGEFYSVGRYTDERGTINLKLFSENILSGFCSFSKISNPAEDQIRMSPYVWVAEDDKNILAGTYEFCTECHNERKKCCCSSPDVDMPVLLKNEAQTIQSSNPRLRKMKEFSHNIRKTSVRQMNESSKVDGQNYCHFYNVSENRCKIYEIRPVDCRLFPFDIKLDTETNEFWVGYYSDICERNLPDTETMKLYAHILRPQLFILFPYANTINEKSVCKRLNNASFEKLYKLEEFIF